MGMMRVVGASVVLALAGVAWAQQGANPVRAGGGSARQAMDKMELAPFPADAWGKLSDWKNGSGIDGAGGGKVVLIVNWSDYAPASKRAFSLAQRLSGKYGKDGLIVVASHSASGWEEAQKPAAAEGGTLLIAHDASGAFRQALHSDADPSYYLIDRSGQMRFAGVASEGVEPAVKFLLGETSEAAGGTKARLAAEQAKKDADSRKPTELRERLDLTTIPEVPFTKPGEEAYTAARWPKLPRDENKKDEIAYLEPREITIPETDWFPKKPKLDGKIVVAYFWHPRVSELTSIYFPMFDQLARQHGRDVVFVGVLSNFNGLSYRGKNLELLKEEQDPEKLRAKMDRFMKARNFEQYLVLDLENTVMNTAIPQDARQEGFVPITLISTDSKARWWGHKPAVTWESALDVMLRVDPGVIARRKAEEEYIRSTKGK